MIIDTTKFNPFVSIIVAPMEPTKQTTEPMDKSILPPVKIQNNIPDASTNTYAF